MIDLTLKNWGKRLLTSICMFVALGSQAQITNGNFATGTFSGWITTPLANNGISIPSPTTAPHSINPQSVYDLNLGVASGGNTNLYPGAAPSDTTNISSIAIGPVGTMPDAAMNPSSPTATLRYPFTGGQSGLVNLDIVGKNVAMSKTSTDLPGYATHGSRATSLKQQFVIPASAVGSDGQVHIRLAVAPVLDNPGLIGPIGLVSATNGSKTLTGVGTKFTALAVGDAIGIGPNSTSVTVSSIQSNTSLTLSSKWTSSSFTNIEAYSAYTSSIGNTAGHFPEQQPFFAIEVRKITAVGNETPVSVTGAPANSPGQLFFTFNFSNQPGTPWSSTTVGTLNYDYSNFQALDIAPGNAKLQVGDTVEVEIVASGCEPGGHEGHIYVNSLGFTPPSGLWVSASAPSSVSSANGTTITYTYTYTNNGSTAVSNVVVAPVMPQDNSPIPQSTTFVSENGATCTPSGGAAATPPTAGGALSCAIGTLAAGASGSFTVTVTIPNSAVGPINNGNYVISGTGASSISGPLVQTALVSASTLSSLSVSVADLPTSATAGTSYSGSYTCTNSASAQAAASSPTCDISGLPAGVGVTGCTISPSASAWTDGTTIPIGATVTCNVSGTPSTTGSVTSVVTSTANNNPTNATASANIVVGAPTGAYLVVNVAGLPTSGLEGVPYTGSYTCTNSGADTADAATCTAGPLPTGLSVSACTLAGSPWTGGAEATIPPGGVITCTVSGTPTESGSTSVTVLSTAGSNDSPSTSYSANPSINIIPTSDLVVSVSGLPTTSLVNSSYSGTYSCSNSTGSADSTAATCDASNLPAGVSVTACTVSPNSNAWTDGSVIPQGQTVACTVSGTTTTSGTSNVTVTTSASNNVNSTTSAVASVVVTGANLVPDAIDGLPNTATVGTVYNGSYTCTNTGNAAAAVSSSPTGPTCDISGLPAGVVVTGCTVSNPSGAWTDGTAIAAGAVVTCSVSGTPSTSGSVTVTVSTMASNDSPSAPTSSSTSVQVSGSDLVVSTSGLPSSATAGQPYNGSFTCSDIGSADAVGASCSVAGLPPGVTVSGCTISTGGSWSGPAAIPAGAVVTCNVSGTPSESSNVDVTVTSTASNNADAGAAINGIVFNDLNANGVQDSVDLGVSGFTVNVYNSSNVLVATTTTTAGGAYSVSGLATGNYTVQIAAPNGTAVTSTNPISLALSVGSTGSTADFGEVSLGANPTSVKTAPTQPVTSSLSTLVNAPPGAVFSVASNPSEGSVTVSPSGSFTYTPGPNAVVGSTDTFQYNICLGTTCATSTVSVVIDPSGIIYNSVTRQPISGATVTLLYNGSPVPASYVTNGQSSETTGSTGYYGWYFTGNAQPGTYSLSVTAPGYGSTPSASIPPSTAPNNFTGGSVGYDGAPPVGQTTTYYLSFPLPTQDILNNNIPLDPTGNTTGIPALSDAGLLMMALMLLWAGLRSRRQTA